MYGFAREPRWIAGHLLTLTLLVVFVAAGVWQLGRHSDRRARSQAVLERVAEQPLEEAALWDAAGADIEWRRVELAGEWSHGDAVLIRNRSLGGLGGCHLAAPVVLGPTSGEGAGPGDAAADAGRAVLVVAGWLGHAQCAAPDAPAAVELARAALAAGPARITGRVRPTQTRGLLGPSDPPTGRLGSLARVDVERVARQVPQALAPVYAELVSADPPPANLAPLGPPVTAGGPHLGYALQWFAFAAVALIGYPLVLRRHARR